MGNRSFIRFSIGFRLLEGVVFAPMTAMIGQFLRGQAVVDSTALVGFFLSPRGFAAAIISSTIFLTLRFMEHAGLSVLVAGQLNGRRPTALSAFKHVLARSAALSRGTFYIFLSGLALLTPLGLGVAYLSNHFLSQHDINYYLQAKPPAFMQAGGLLVVLALITVGAGLWLAVRWRWVPQILMFESGSVWSAFRRSAKLAQPVWLGIAWRWAALGGVNFVLGASAAWIGRVFLPLGLKFLGEGQMSLGFVLGGLWVMQGLIGASFTLVGAVLEAQVFTRFYLRITDRPIHSIADAVPLLRGQLSAGAIAVGVTILILLGGAAGSIWGGGALFAERPMLVIAHRASVTDAPENTVAAVNQAIKDGADVAEVDVQLSSDGVVVLAHDSDFSRVAGVAKRVPELAWSEISKLDVGGSFPPQFQGTRPARLEEILEAARGRIRLNIELKHYAPVDGQLEESVWRIVEQKGMAGQVEIQSLEFDALEIIRRLNADVKVGYLMSVNARHPENLSVDFLSVQMSRVDARFLRRAHRRGLKVYVWTVDDEPLMEKALALGVDGLITNRSSVASTFIKDWAALSPNQKALRRLKFWLET